MKLKDRSAAPNSKNPVRIKEMQKIYWRMKNGAVNLSSKYSK